MINDPPDRQSIWLATLVAAPAAAGVVTAAILQSPWMALPAFVVAILHAVPLGLPSYLALRRRGWANLGTAIFTGACAGVTPIGLLTLWPVAHASAYSGGAWQAIDGVRTAAGWIEWSKLAGFLAANGAAAGAAFWATIRFWPGNRSGQTIDEVFA